MGHNSWRQDKDKMEKGPGTPPYIRRWAKLVNSEVSFSSTSSSSTSSTSSESSSSTSVSVSSESSEST